MPVRVGPGFRSAASAWRSDVRRSIGQAAVPAMPNPPAPVVLSALSVVSTPWALQRIGQSSCYRRLGPVGGNQNPTISERLAG
jgi:hypothetical protein